MSLSKGITNDLKSLFLIYIDRLPKNILYSQSKIGCKHIFFENILKKTKQNFIENFREIKLMKLGK